MGRKKIDAVRVESKNFPAPVRRRAIRRVDKAEIGAWVGNNTKQELRLVRQPSQSFPRMTSGDGIVVA